MNKHNQLYTYFGCKKKLIEEVWSNYFHDIDMLVEPFAGTAVIACNKPDTVNIKNMYLNDYDCHIANVLRAVVYDPEGLIDYICHPRLELDLHMIHDYLTGSKPYLRDLLMKNIDAHDVKLAGWWVWGLNHWIGGSWCNCELKSIDDLTNHYDKDFFLYPNDIKQDSVSTRRRKPRKDNTITHQNISTVRRKPQHNNQCTHQNLSTRRKKTINDNIITHQQTNCRREHVSDIVYKIYDQLSEAKILYGDFERVLTGSYLNDSRTKCGIFLDPPYQNNTNTDNSAIYGSTTQVEDHGVFDRALKWFLDNYKNPKYKIILCGHKDSFIGIPEDIKKVSWKRGSGYANDQTSRDTEMYITNCL